MRKLKDLLHLALFSAATKYRTPSGHARIYHYHIEKTGGTSLTQMFLEAASRQSGGRAGCIEPAGHSADSRPEVQFLSAPWYRRRLPASRSRDGNALQDDVWAAHRHRVAVNGLVFQAGDKERIMRGDYFYGWAHIPVHQLTLPPKTFTITALRNPVDRLISYYQVLLGKRVRGDGGKWDEDAELLGQGFEDFLERLPREHLFRQIYYFSPSFDIDEAYERIRRCDFFYFTENTTDAADALSRQVGLELRPLWSNRASTKFKISQRQLKLAREVLSPEIALHSRLMADQAKFVQPGNRRYGT